MDHPSLFVVVLVTVLVGGHDAASLPETKLTTAGLIKYWNYPVETHTATTTDGYILTLFRIPYGKDSKKAPLNSNSSRPVFLLQHALMSSSADWVDNTPEQSLGFLLADAGYDVWLGNVRGNRYCKKHTSIDVTSKEFWDFSFEEHASHDLPTMVDYILQHTQEQQLNYVGHSQGTVLAFAGLSMNTQLQDKMRVVFALGPITRMMDVNRLVRMIASQWSKIALIWKMFGVEEFFPSDHSTGKYCKYIPKVCTFFMNLVAGKDNKFMNRTRIPIYFAHTPAGTSRKNMLHWFQIVHSGRFAKYDYGWVENLRRYNHWNPPEYDISTIHTPVALITGSHDTLATTKGAIWTSKHIQTSLGVTVIPEYNHMDFIWGNNAAQVLHKKIIDMAKKF